MVSLYGSAGPKRLSMVLLMVLPLVKLIKPRC